MTADEDSALEDRFTDLLAGCDEALASGGWDGNGPPPADVPLELRDRVERGLNCLRRLRARREPRTLPWPVVESTAGQDQFGDRFDRFEVLQELGRGGWGVVFLAYDPLLNRKVALKVPRPEVAVAPEFAERFAREARAAAGLNHPNVVPVYEVGSAGVVRFLVSAYYPGVTLASWLRQRTEPVPFHTAAALVAPLAEAVQHAHDRGVIHRDLKPSNVLLEPGAHASAQGESSGAALGFTPRVTDFGLAKLLFDEPSLGETRTGAVMGTASYMAPEQASGKSKEIGPSADVYALGAILYEVLTGRPPFQGESDLEILLQVRSYEPMAPKRLRTRLPRDLETICLRCLEKDPSRRYARAGDMGEDLRRFMADRPIRARPIGQLARAWRWCRRRPALAGMTAAVAGLLIVVSMVSTLSYLRQRELTAAADLARDHEMSAKIRERAQRRRAEDLLEREYVRRAAHFSDGADLHEALPWTLEAIKLARDAPAREAIHRRRFAAARLQGPRLLRAWLCDTAVICAASCADGRCVLIGDRAGTVWICDVRTGQPVYPPLRSASQLKAAMLSADGRYALLTSAESGVSLYAFSNGRPERLWHRDLLARAAISPDARLLVTAARDGVVEMWDIQAARSVARFPLGPKAGITFASFSPDGRWIVVSGADKRARVWRSATMELARELLHDGHVGFASFSRDGRVVTAAYPDARVWDLESGKLCAKLDHVTTVLSAAFSPDGKRIVTASLDNTAGVWDSASGRLIVELRHEDSVHFAMFTPDARSVVTACRDGTARVWDAETGRTVIPACKHNGPVFTAIPDPSRTILTASEDGTARLWTWPQPYQTLVRHADRVYHASFSPDGQAFVTASFDGSAQVWDTATGRPRWTTPLRHSRLVRRARFSPDGRAVATVTEDGMARVWDAAAGAPLLPDWIKHPGSAAEISFSPDGARLLTFSKGPSACIWNAATGALLRVVTHGRGLNHAEFSPDGRRVATAAAYGTVRVWDAETGDPVVELPNRDNPIQASFSPDGRFVVTRADSSVRVWNAQSGAAVGVPMKHQGVIRSVAFSPDGRLLVTAGTDNRAQVWEAATGQPLTAPLRHEGRLERAEFSPDGQLVLTASLDRTARVWEVATGQPVTPPLRHDAPVWHGEFSRDGRRVLTASGDCTARVWNISADERPLSELNLLAQMVSGRDLRDPDKGLPLDESTFRRGWFQLRGSASQEFSCVRLDGSASGERLPPESSTDGRR